MTVLFFFMQMFRSSFLEIAINHIGAFYIIINAVKESNPEVGSSRRITLGSVTSSNPIEVLFRSPPESPFSITPPIYQLFFFIILLMYVSICRV